MEPWIDGLWEALESVLKEEHDGTSNSKEGTLQQGGSNSAARRQEAKDTGSERHVDLEVVFASESEMEGKPMKPAVVTGDQRQAESSNNQESEIRLVQTPSLDSTVSIRLQSANTSESDQCSHKTETTAGVADVVSGLGADVRKQLTLSSTTMSSTGDPTTFSEFESRLRAYDELREMQLTMPSMQPPFIKVELVEVCCNAKIQNFVFGRGHSVKTTWYPVGGIYMQGLQ